MADDRAERSDRRGEASVAGRGSNTTGGGDNTPGRPSGTQTNTAIVFPDGITGSLLKLRIPEVQTGKLQDVSVRKVPVGELLDDLLADYRSNNPRSFDRFANPAVTLHLRPHFGEMRASALTTNHLRDYLAARDGEGAAVATVNREIQLLLIAWPTITTPLKSRPSQTSKVCSARRLTRAKAFLNMGNM